MHIMLMTLLKATAIGVTVVLWPGSALAQMQELGTLGGNVCTAENTNDNGAVIGTCRDMDGDIVAAYWAPGSAAPVPLPTLEADGPCDVYDINNANIAAGNCEFGATGERFPVRWNTTLPGSAPQQLNPSGAQAKATASIINHAGTVAGVSIESNGSSHTVIWKPGQTTPTTLPELGLLPPLLPTSTECQIADMSDGASPIVVGSCQLRNGGSVAVKWKPGLLGYGVTELPRLPGGSNCAAAAVNGAEQVAGTCENAVGDIVAVRWTSAGTGLTWLDDLAATGVSRQQLSVVDMNEAGIIVGNYVTDSGFGQAFVWAPTGNPETETGLDVGSLGGFWTKAIDIADNGYVVGIAQNGKGLGEGFLWTPVSEISGLGTLGGFTSGVAALSDNGNWWTGASQVVAGYPHAYLDGVQKRAARQIDRALLSSEGDRTKSASGGNYTTRYDNVDVGQILKSDRLFSNYYKCLMDEGRCTPDGQELKRIQPGALADN